MEKPILNDPEIFPTGKVLENVLVNCYPVFELLINKVTTEPFGLAPEWRYYKDGHAWLCKVVHKKKTIFWLSVWDGYFKTTFYFTEKTGAGIAGLKIGDELKDTFSQNKHIGKLIPLTLSMHTTEQIDDLLRIVAYKMSLK
jgi:hypothetical protein